MLLSLPLITQCIKESDHPNAFLLLCVFLVCLGSTPDAMTDASSCLAANWICWGHGLGFVCLCLDGALAVRHARENNCWPFFINYLYSLVCCNEQMPAKKKKTSRRLNPQDRNLRLSLCREFGQILAARWSVLLAIVAASVCACGLDGGAKTNMSQFHSESFPPSDGPGCRSPPSQFSHA